MSDPYDDVVRAFPSFSTAVVGLPLRAIPARLPDTAKIPPRQWLYGTMLLRGFLSVLVAPGGAGKSQFAMGVALALSSGQPIFGHHVHRRVNTWVLNLEDPLDEIDRRLAALLIQHNIEASSVKGRIFLHSGRDRRVCLAARAADGSTFVYPDKDAIVQACRDNEIGVLVVDPCVKSHSLLENSNDDMDALATAWAEVAEAANCAIFLIHHVRKGAIVDIDAARGGKSLTDACRAALILQAMTEEEADKLSVDKGERWKHVRLDDAKANMAPRAGVASWYRMQMVSLNNGTPDYPHGDNVAALERWEPPSTFAALSDAELNTALDRIDEGPGVGRYGAGRGCGPESDRWAGHVLTRQLGVTVQQAAHILETWIASGLLERRSYDDAGQRKRKIGLFVNNERRPGTE